MTWVGDAAAHFENAVLTASVALLGTVVLILLFALWLVRREGSSSLLNLAELVRAIYPRRGQTDDDVG